MPGNDRQRGFGQIPVNHVQIRPADTAGLDGDLHLVLPGNRNRQLPQLQRLPGVVEHHGLHAAVAETVCALSIARATRVVRTFYLRVIA